MRVQATGFLTAILIAIGVSAIVPFRGNAQPTQASEILVRGYLITNPLGRLNERPIRDPNKAGGIYLPGKKVFLKNLTTGADSQSTITDTSGRFTVMAPGEGRYIVCVIAQGFQNRCSNNQIDGVFSLSNNQPFMIGRVLALPIIDKDRFSPMYGRVTFRDGSNPRTFQPYVNIDAFPTVSLKTGDGKIQTVAVNFAGEYVFGAVPIRDDMTLSTNIEGLKQEVKISIITAIPEPKPFNIRLKNSRPRLAPIAANDSNKKRIDIARPGQNIRLSLQVTDDDRDTIKYLWDLGPTGGSLDRTDAATVNWTVPTTPGLYSISANVGDGRGGYDRQSLHVYVSNGGVRFTGTVRDNFGEVVPNANVSVNSTTSINTDAQGKFRLEAPPAPKYVLNIQKFGYGIVSKILLQSLTAAEYVMSKAQVFTGQDPTQVISLTQQRTEKDCPPLLAARLTRAPPLTAGPGPDPRIKALLEVQFQDGKGRSMPTAQVEQLMARNQIAVPPGVPITVGGRVLRDPTRQDRPCGPGVSIDIPKNALVDDLGRPPPGKVNVALSTINLGSPGQMPGDGGALSNNQLKYMESFGAGTITISDGKRRYNLKKAPGNTAAFTIPIDPLQAKANAKSVIPILFYDPKLGLWKEEDSAKLNPSKTAYVAQLKHFSAVNADHTKTDQSCIAVEHDFIGEVAIEYTIPGTNADDAPETRTATLEANAESVIYNLPTDKPITIVVIKDYPNSQVKDLPIQTKIAAGVFVVVTKGQDLTKFPNPPTDPPFYEDEIDPATENTIGACKAKVFLTDGLLPSDKTNPNNFLEGAYSVLRSAGSDMFKHEKTI